MLRTLQRTGKWRFLGSSLMSKSERINTRNSRMERKQNVWSDTLTFCGHAYQRMNQWRKEKKETR